MRRMILTTLVLLPVMAHAQASTSAEPQPSPSSAVLEAELNRPAAPAPAASITALNTANHAVVRESVDTQMTESFVDAAMRKGGTLEYTYYGSIPTEASAPSVTRAVEVALSADELAAQPAVTNVIVHATVDADGFPRNLTISKSAGALMDKRVLAAVSQYRFKPATMDNKPVDAAVTISVKIEKP